MNAHSLGLCVFFSFLALPALAQVTEFPSGPEFPAVHHAPFELPAGGQNDPGVAFDGTNYLVVWADYRGDKAAILGARISRSGEILDPVGFVISDPVTDALVTEPAVAWNGESFLVVWESGFFTIAGRRISPDGEFIDPTVRTFFTGGFVTPLVASNGDSFLIVDGGDLPRAGLMDHDGAFRSLETASFEGLAGRTASVASDGSDYVIAVSGRNTAGIFAVLITADGAVGQRQTVPANSQTTGISTHILWTGSSYLATWINRSRADANDPRDLTWGHYLERTGEPDGTPFLIHDAPASSFRYQACATETESVIVWNLFSFGQRDPRLLSATVRGLTVSERSAVATESLSPSGIALSCAGDDPLLFWSGGTATTRGLYFRHLSESPDEARSVTRSVPRQTHASSLTTQQASLLLWEEETGRSSQIRIGIAAGDGRVARGSERAVAPSTVSQRHPLGASDGTSVLVIWTEQDRFPRRLFGTRIGLRGERLDAEPFLISDALGFVPDPETLSSIVWNGQQYLVAWADEDKRIRMSRITSGGIVLDPGGALVMESSRKVDQSRPALAVADNGMALLTWQDGMKSYICQITCPPPPPPARVTGALIAQGGTVASSAEIEISEDRYALEPVVAWNGHHFLVIWKGEGIEGRRLTAEGQPASGPGGAEFLILAEHKQTADSLALIPDGDRFIAAWSETNRGSWDTLVGGRIFASVIERDGVVRGPSQVSPGAGNDRRPAILRTSAGGILFYYDRNVPETPYLNVRRLFATGTTGFSIRRRPARLNSMAR